MKKYRALCLLAAIGMLFSSPALGPAARAQGESTLVIDFSVDDPVEFRPARFELVRTDEGDRQVVHTAEVDEAKVFDLSVPSGTYTLYVQDRQTGIIEKLPAHSWSGSLSSTGAAEWQVADMLDFPASFESSLEELRARFEAGAAQVADWEHFPDEVVVKFIPGTPISAVYEANEFAGARVRKLLTNIGVYRMQVLGTADLDRVIQTYLADPWVEFAEPNGIVRATAIPTDWGTEPDSDHWPFHEEHDFDMDAPEAWNQQTGLPSIIVAVVDTGLDFDVATNTGHPDLENQVWTNAGEIPGNGQDDDGNGFADDIHGWYFNNIWTDSNDISDGHGHGTHVAGLVGAEANNGTPNRAVGMSYSSVVMPIKVDLTIPDELLTGTTELAAAIQYAADNGAAVINMSWRTNADYSVVHNAIIDAYNRGVVLIAAAGNHQELELEYPARYNEVMAVANLWRATVNGVWTLRWHPTSNRGDKVNFVAAPGMDICSTWLQGQGDGCNSASSNYSFDSGTSMASPLVAGTAALVLSEAEERGKTLSPALVYDVLKFSADYIADPDNDGDDDSIPGNDPPRNSYVGYGKVNANGAVGALVPPTVFITNPTAGATVSGIQDVTALVYDPNPITHVDFYVDSNLVGTDTAAPWQVPWDTAGYPDGSSHSMEARAFDTFSGFPFVNPGSQSISVVVDNRPPGPSEVAVTASPTTVEVGQKSTITARVTDEGSQPVVGDEVSFSSNGFPGAFIDCATDDPKWTDSTDSNGEAVVCFRPNSAGTATLSATASNGLSGQTQLNATPASDNEMIFEFRYFRGEETWSIYRIRVQLKDADGEPIGNEYVTVSTSLGQLSEDWGNWPGPSSLQVRTDGLSGIAELYLRTTVAGDAMITADWAAGQMSKTVTVNLQVGYPDLITQPAVTFPNLGCAYGVDWYDDKIASIGSSGVCVWDASTWSQTPLLRDTRDEYQSGGAIMFSPSGSELAFGGNGIKFGLFKVNASTLSPAWGDPYERRFYYDLDWRHDGQRIIIDNTEDRATIWRASNGASMGQTPALSNRVFSVRYSPDGSYIAEMDRDGYFHLLTGGDSPSQICSDEVWYHDDGKRDLGLDWAPDSSAVAVAAEDTVRLYNAGQCSSPRILSTAYTPTDEMYTVAWSPDGNMVAAGGYSNHVHIWDPDSGAEIVTLQALPYDQQPRTIVWSPGSDMIAVADGSRIKVFMPFDYSPPQVQVFSPANGSQTAQTSVLVEGQVTDDLVVSGATIEVNGGAAQVLTLDSAGNFEYTVALNVGANTIKVTGTDGNQNSSSVTISVQRLSDENPPLITQGDATPESGEFCTSFTLTARVVDTWSGVDPASVTAHIQHPDAADVATVALYDDGSHGDALADDDFFTGQWDSCVAVAEGTYYIDVGASDNEGNPAYANNVATFQLYDLPAISDVSHSPMSPTDTDAVVVSATIWDASGVSNATLLYSTDGGSTYVPVSMSYNTGLAKYQGTVPAQDAGEVRYRIEALDTWGHLGTSSLYMYTVTDATPPGFYGWQHSPPDLMSSSSGPLTIQVSLYDTGGSGLAGKTPQLKYKRGSADGAYSAFQNMTWIADDTWSYAIPEPAAGWSSIAEENVTWIAQSSDVAGNVATSSEMSEFVDPIDELGPLIGTPSFTSSVPSDAVLGVNSTISDSSTGNHGVDTATLHYGYSSPYNQYQTAGTSPGGNGDGTWSFSVPVQGASREGSTLRFSIEACDGDESAACTTDTNSGSYYSVVILDNDSSPPVFSSPSPTSATESDSITLQVNIYDPSGIHDTTSSTSSVYLQWDTDGEFASDIGGSLDMDLLSGNTYRADAAIGPFAGGTTVSWRVFAEDNDNTRTGGWSPTYEISVGDDDSTGPAIGTPAFATSVPSDQQTIVAVSVSDAAQGNHGVDAATLHCGYSSPYDQYQIPGTGPAGNGDGTWTFAIPAQGDSREYENLKFSIVACDNDNSPSCSTKDNSGACYSITIGDDDTSAPSFSNPSPASAREIDTISLQVDISDPSGVYDTASQNASVYCQWDTDGEFLADIGGSLDMNSMSGNTYQAGSAIGPFPADTVVSWRVWAEDDDNTHTGDWSDIYSVEIGPWLSSYLPLAMEGFQVQPRPTPVGTHTPTSTSTSTPTTTPTATPTSTPTATPTNTPTSTPTNTPTPTEVSNNPPHEPTDCSPSDGSDDQSVFVDLRWTGGDPDGDSVTYHVYLEADNPSPGTLVCDDSASETCDPGTLEHSTHYYWQVVATDEHGESTAGPVWDFHTAEACWIEHRIKENWGNANSAHAVDIDQDGDLDVLAGSIESEDITWWENDGAESFTEHTIRGDLYWASGAFAEDVDQDGDVDVFGTSMARDEVLWWENDGSESFTEHVISDNFGGAADLCIADVDGDNILDVVGTAMYAHQVCWWQNDGNQNFTQRTVDSSFHRPMGVYATDIDGDTDVDVVAAARDDDEIAWWENQGGTPPTFAKHTIVGDFLYANKVYATDVDGDGDVDILGTAIEADAIAWFENDGDQSFTEHIVVDGFVGAYDVYALDMDHDGDVDVLGTAHEGSQVAWFENDGNEGFTEHTIAGGFGGANSVYAIDLNGAGGVDVVASAGADGVVAWWENSCTCGPNCPPNQAGDPAPDVGAVDQPVTAALSWSGGDPNGDQVTYDVYLEPDNTSPGVLVCEDSTSTTCDPGPLQYSTHYYWKVVSTDQHSASTAGPVWDFTTAKLQECVLFEEDFADDLSQWTLWGSPQSYIATTMGNPAPSLQTNGDANLASGVTSVPGFPLASGTTITFDGRLEQHAWGNSFAVFLYRDWSASDTSLANYSVSMGCGGSGTCGDTWCCEAVVWNGTAYEVNNSLPNITAGPFHHFKAEVLDDLRVSFYIDDMSTPAWTSSSSADASYAAGPIVIGGRIGWVDNVVISSPCLLREDFGGDLSQWTLFGSPDPHLDSGYGNPAPSFQINGDASYSNGALSTVGITPSPGMAISFDLRIGHATDPHHWSGLGLSREWYADEQYQNWEPLGIVASDLTHIWFGCGSVPLEDTDFHSFLFVVLDDYRLEAYMDDMATPRCTTEFTVSPLEFNSIPILIGGREGHVDNVVVRP